MSSFNHQLAFQYALERLTHDLSDQFVYHNVWHTRDEVVPAIETIAAKECIEDETLLLLKTAAWYHDLGCIVQRQEHEAIGIGIVAATLPQYGYSPGQIHTIGRLIWATRLPQTPVDMLGQILADSDLDVLGRADFFDRNHILRHEMALLGQTFSDREWFQNQIKFMREHTYFTPTARRLRAAQKQRNLEQLQELLIEAEYMEEG